VAAMYFLPRNDAIGEIGHSARSNVKLT
jgi:hypothetical protein